VADGKANIKIWQVNIVVTCLLSISLNDEISFGAISNADTLDQPEV
jgi:hypothetical protein